MSRALLIVLFASIASAAAFGPADMLSVVNFADEPVISPDGKWVAYSTADGSDQANIQARHPTAFLRVVPATGGPAKRILDNDHADTPVWSPDGSKLGFVRWRGTHRKVMLWDTASGATREVGEDFAEDRSVWASEGLTLHWTPDGKNLVVAAMQAAAPAPASPRFTVIKSADAVVPGDVFFVDKRMWKLGTIDVASGSVKYLSPNAFALRSIAIAADGRTAMFRAVTPETLGHFRAEKTEVWLVALDGSSAPRQVSQGRGWTVFSPDGRELIYPEAGSLHAKAIAGGADRVVANGFPASTRAAAVSGSWLAVLASRPGTGPKDPNMYSILRPDEDVLVVDLSSGKSKTLTTRTEEVGDLTWGGSNLFYRTIDPVTYRETVHRWVAGEEKPSEIFSGDEALARFSAATDGRRLSFTSMTATRPADAYVFDSGKRTSITKLNPQLEKFEFVAPKMFDFYSEDGDKLQALLFRPSGEHVPVVTYTYEKLSSQKNRFNPEAQMHVTHGYAYLEPDILVKPGFTGESFVKATVPAVNAVRAMGFTNGKFGINGGSFGGYSGLYLISHVDTFAAAVLRAPPSDFFSTWADGRDRDIWTIDNGQARAVGSPWTSQKSYINNSPFFSADRVHTPVLIMHGEKDYTVPTQQGEMMFYALRYLGRTAELVLYRDGDHSITRGSRDDYLDYYQRTLDWWGKYLQ
jgi:dipeptidyl aminopeptidase/acylaminoacyl peptidase